MDADPPAPPINKPAASLKRRAARGAAWTTAQFGLTSFSRLASNLILTRLLAPEAFGLIGVVVMIQFLVSMISDIGIKSSIIRSDNTEDPDFTSTAFMLQFGRGVLIAIIIGLFAALVAIGARAGWFPPASIYMDPRVPYFMLFGAGAALIQGAYSIKFQLAERYFRMGWISVTQLSGQVLSSVVTIAIAFYTRDPIALAIGILIGPVIIAVASHAFFEGPPFATKIRRKYVDEMFNFGVWILVASLFSFFAQRGAQLLFGFLLNAKEFSYLSIALIWITVARQGLRTVQRRVALPAFSELRRERPQEQTRAYYRMRLVSDAFALVVFLGTLFIAGPILDFVYPENYDRVIYYVQLLSVTMLFVPYELLDTVLLSRGSSRQFSAIKFVTAAAILIGIPIAYYTVGPDMAVLVAAVAPAAGVPLTLLYGQKTIKLNPLREAVLLVIASAGFIYLLMR